MGELGRFLVDHWVLSTAFLVIVILIIMNESRRKLLGFRDVTPADAVNLINRENAQVVDVRDDKEFASGHIINSIHTPLVLMESQLDKLGDDKNRPVIVCCQTGQRSAKAASVLSKHGFSRVYKLGGGMMSWQSANLPTVR